MSKITTKDGTEIFYKDGALGNQLFLAMAGRLMPMRGKVRWFI